MRKSVALTASLSLLLLASLPLALQGRSLLQASQSEPIPLLNQSTSNQKHADYVDLTHAFNSAVPIWRAADSDLPTTYPARPLVVIDNNSKIKKGTPVMLVAIALVKPAGATHASPRVLAVRSVDSLQTAMAILQPPAAPAPKQAHLLKRSTTSVTKSTL
ncbi:MAG TPA: hypothetical protein VFE11_08200 [Dongiaceae bacterium]|nr:hypothetical protein [Dongiaceae bacterium]